MRKLFLMRNPELFQGQKQLKTNKNYFEGWYFKQTNYKESVSFIPGININNHEKKAFVQVITNNVSYFIDYDINDFKYSYDTFYIKIGNNFFSIDRVHIDIRDDNQNLMVYGDIQYSNSKNIDTNLLNPNIMGPFSYILFMECNYAILSMKNRADGVINVNEENMIFNDGVGYIEKDWGCSFPNNYVWCQGNHFENKDASFMLSMADIPFKIFHFRGIICVLIVDGCEYRFATYNGARLLDYNIDGDTLNMQTKYDSGLKLSAPVKGKMEKDIFESISAVVEVTLKKNKETIFSGFSQNCGLEIVCK